MGTAVLRSQDCLRGRFRQEALSLTPTSNRYRRNPNPISNTSHNRRRKRSPVAVSPIQHDRDRSRCRDSSLVDKCPTTNLVMGQVKILKRGEKLSSEENHGGIVDSAGNRKARAKSEEDLDLVLGSTDRLGPDPETVQKQVRVSDLKDAIYAGSACVTSPPPSSVPVPGFLGKNGVATSDLRRLLRLDLA